MKTAISLLSAVLFFGCAKSYQLKTEDSEKIKSLQLYLIKPFSKVVKIDPSGNEGETTQFDRCTAVSIIQIKTDVLGEPPFIIDFKDSNGVLLRGTTRFYRGRYTPIFDKKTERPINIETLALPILPVEERRIKLAKDKTESSKKLMCSGNVFTGMKKSELLFVMGAPTEINSSTHAGIGVNEQWVYPTSEEFKNQYFYFRNNILTSWQD